MGLKSACLLCYPANLQHGAENSSGVKSVLWLPLLCFEKKIYMCSGLLLSLIYYRTGAKERKTASAKNAFGNVLSISTSCFIKLQFKKNVFTNGTHGVSIVKMCLLKNSFHKRSYCAKEVIFSLWGPLTTFYLLSPKNSCYGIFGILVIVLVYHDFCAYVHVCMCVHMCTYICVYVCLYVYIWILFLPCFHCNAYYYFAVGINYFQCFGNVYIIMLLKGA